jgi:iron complex transport system substrate-binding protein
MNRIRCRWLLFVAFTVLLTPCWAQPRQATDSAGRVILLRQPAQRIVSLAPHITELLFAAGAGTQVVGVSEFSDYPAAAQSLPKVARATRIDLERLLALRPDLVVAWTSQAHRQSLARLEQLGLSVFLSEPRTFEDIATHIEALGVLAGTSTHAQTSAASFRAQLAALRQAQSSSAPLLRVFYQIESRPWMTLNGTHWVSQALSLCGAQNIFADARVIAPIVDAEAILANPPQVIIFAPTDQSAHTWQNEWRRRLPQLPAVRDARWITVDANTLHRPSPRILPATQALCRALDPVR